LPRPTQTMPGFIKPQLATPKSRAPKGDQWLHEIKFDGYRIQVHVNGGRKKVYTRNGLDWTNRFSVIAGALDFSGQAIIDGEVASMKGAPTSRNCRLNLPPVDRIDLSTSPSISFGVMETSGSSHRSSASRHCWTCSVETASGLPWFTVNISSATDRRFRANSRGSRPQRRSITAEMWRFPCPLAYFFPLSAQLRACFASTIAAMRTQRALSAADCGASGCIPNCTFSASCAAYLLLPPLLAPWR